MDSVPVIYVLVQTHLIYSAKHNSLTLFWGKVLVYLGYAEKSRKLQHARHACTRAVSFLDILYSTWLYRLLTLPRYLPRWLSSNNYSYRDIFKVVEIFSFFYYGHGRSSCPRTRLQVRVTDIDSSNQDKYYGINLEWNFGLDRSLLCSQIGQSSVAM